MAIMDCALSCTEPIYEGREKKKKKKKMTYSQVQYIWLLGLVYKLDPSGRVYLFPYLASGACVVDDFLFLDPLMAMGRSYERVLWLLGGLLKQIDFN